MKHVQKPISSTTKHHETSPLKSFSPLTKKFLAESKKKEISHREERLLNGVPEVPHERDSHLESPNPEQQDKSRPLTFKEARNDERWPTKLQQSVSPTL